MVKRKQGTGLDVEDVFPACKYMMRSWFIYFC